MLLVVGIIIANLAVSILGFRALRTGQGIDKFLFMPARVARGENLLGAVLSGFSHSGFGHLAFNMLSFFFFGPTVVRWGGTQELLLVYVVSLVAADVLVFALRFRDEQYRSLGASGAVSGVIFAAIVLDPQIDVFLFLLPIPIPGPVFALGFVVLSILMARREGGGVSHEAHVGGALAGFAVAALVAPNGLSPLWQRLSGFLS